MRTNPSPHPTRYNGLRPSPYMGELVERLLMGIESSGASTR